MIFCTDLENVNKVFVKSISDQLFFLFLSFFPLRSGTGSRRLIQEKTKKKNTKPISKTLILGETEYDILLKRVSFQGKSEGGKTKLLQLLRRAKPIH